MRFWLYELLAPRPFVPEWPSPRFLVGRRGLEPRTSALVCPEALCRRAFTLGKVELCARDYCGLAEIDVAWNPTTTYSNGGPGTYGASSASSIRATPAALKGVAARTRESLALAQALR